MADGTAVCATLNAEVAAAGEPVMNCLSALLPAEATVSTPSADAVVHRRRQIVVERLAIRRTERHVDDVDAVRGIRRHRSDRPRSPWPATARCRCSEVAGAEQAFTAYINAPGATPLLTGDDVGDMRAVAAVRGGIRRGESDPDPERAAQSRPRRSIARPRSRSHRSLSRSGTARRQRQCRDRRRLGSQCRPARQESAPQAVWECGAQAASYAACVPGPPRLACV